MSNNTIAPFGLRPVRMIDGSPLNFASTTYFVNTSDAAAVFVGDLLVAGTQTVTSNPLYLPTAKSAAAGASNSLGVCVSVDPIMAFGTNLVGTENLIRQYLPASTNGYIVACIDSRVVFEIQLLNLTAIYTTSKLTQGYNVDIITSTAGSTTTGLSGQGADGSNIATTSTLPLRVIGFSHRVGNDPTGQNPLLEVVLNTVQPARS